MALRMRQQQSNCVAIAEWLQNKQTDPSTNQPLTIDQLCPNRTVRSMIEDSIAKGPDLIQPS
mgnify:CR=1 FL=1